MWRLPTKSSFCQTFCHIVNKPYLGDFHHWSPLHHLVAPLLVLADPPLLTLQLVSQFLQRSSGDNLVMLANSLTHFRRILRRRLRIRRRCSLRSRLRLRNSIYFVKQPFALFFHVFSKYFHCKNNEFESPLIFFLHEFTLFVLEMHQNR